MNRQTFNALCAQYATPETSGDGRVEWDGGKKCVIPSVKLYGAAMQDGTPTPDNPVVPVCNDGTFAALGRNLLDVNETAYGFINNTGNITNAIYNRVSDYIPAIQGHILTVFTNKSLFNIGYALFSKADTSGYIARKDNNSVSVVKISVPDEARYVRVWFDNRNSYSDLDELDLETLRALHPLVLQGDYSDIPTDTHYHNGGEVTAPELWAIPGTEYRDEWDAQTGRGVRRVNKLVCTPDQNWQIWTGNENEYPFAYISGVKIPKDLTGMFSHGRYDNVVTSSDKVLALVYYSSIVRIRVGHEASVDDFKAFLQEQIDANTPVTIWHPLAEPEPFYHPPAKLTMPTGYGQIIQTGGSIADCPITVKYLTHS